MTYLHDKNVVHGRLTSVNIYIEPNQGVKISLIDNDEQAIASIGTCCDSAKQNLGSHSTGASFEFNLTAMTYLSPELMRTIKVVEGGKEEKSDKLIRGCTANKLYIDTNKLSKESDIFSFGTLLFELFYEQFPFGEPLLSPASRPFEFGGKQRAKIKLSASELIYQIGSGQIALKNLPHQSNGFAQNTDCYYSTLVNDVISNCWQTDPANRPTFRQLKMAFDK